MEAVTSRREREKCYEPSETDYSHKHLGERVLKQSVASVIPAIRVNATFGNQWTESLETCQLRPASIPGLKVGQPDVA
jgi:hypothetical protein